MSEQQCLSIPMLHLSPSGLPNKRRFHVLCMCSLYFGLNKVFVKLILLRPRSSFSGTIEVWQNSGLSTKVSGAFSPVLVSLWFFLLFSCVLSRGYGSCRYFPHPIPSRSPPSLNMPYTATASLRRSLPTQAHYLGPSQAIHGSPKPTSHRWLKPSAGPSKTLSRASAPKCPCSQRPQMPDQAPTSPNNFLFFFWGGGGQHGSSHSGGGWHLRPSEVDLPWPPESPDPPRTDEFPAPPWPPELPAPPLIPERAPT